VGTKDQSSAAQPELRQLAWRLRRARTAHVGIAELTDESIRFLPLTKPSQAFDLALAELTKVRFSRLGGEIKLYTERTGRITLCFTCVGDFCEEPPKDRAELLEAAGALMDSTVGIATTIAGEGVDTQFEKLGQTIGTFGAVRRARTLSEPWRSRLTAALASSRPPGDLLAARQTGERMVDDDSREEVGAAASGWRPRSTAPARPEG
jgi:hypothetical protein